MLMSLPIRDMKNDTLLTLTLPKNYGYCILVAVGSMFIVEYKAMKVEQARKTYNVPHPVTYSKEGDFNSIQSDYQNMLEKYPQFLGLLLVGGLDSPILSATGGTIIVLGKVASSISCCNKDVKKKICCAIQYVGLLIMAASTTKLAFRLLEFI